MKRILSIMTVAILTGILPLAAHAQWSAPTQSPPNGNAPAPLNVSATTQTKSGTLIVGSLGSSGGGYLLGNVGIGVSSPGYKLQVGAAGDGTAVGANAYYYISDRSLKANIENLNSEKSLSNILRLQGVSFDWKKTGTPSVGLVAQDVEKVYPSLVHEDPTTGLKSVEYANLVAPLIEAVKAQQKEINMLKAQVAELTAR